MVWHVSRNLYWAMLVLSNHPWPLQTLSEVLIPLYVSSMFSVLMLHNHLARPRLWTWTSAFIFNDYILSPSAVDWTSVPCPEMYRKHIRIYNDIKRASKCDYLRERGRNTASYSLIWLHLSIASVCLISSFVLYIVASSLYRPLQTPCVALSWHTYAKTV